MLKRLFLAIPLNEKYLGSLKEFCESQGNLAGVKWTDGQNLHITLLFLGDVEERHIPSIVYNLKSKVTKPFYLLFKGLVLAPPGRPPRMIWAKFEKSNHFDKLVSAAYGQVQEFIQIALQKESIPHVTLARFKDYVDWRKINLPQLKFKPLQVSMFYLMESTLTPRGPIYQKLAEFKLNA